MTTMITTEHAKAGNGSRKTQSFSFAAPKASRVQLAGDFTQWQKQPINMRKGEDGIWRTTVELSLGAHPYRYLVDGQWQDDPQCPLHVPNPFGSKDAVRQVS